MKICKKIIAVLMILSVCLTFSISVNAAENDETTAPETTSAASAGTEVTAEKKISDSNSDTDSEKRNYYFSENTDGNAELVANEKVITDNGLFQFIAVTTRSGDVFYVIIDNSKEENNVYFLNDVDTFDLQALLSKDDGSDTVKVGESAEIEATTESGAAENADSENKKESDSKQGGNYTSIFILLGIVVLGGIGFVIFKIKKGGFGKKKAQTDLLDDDFDDELDDEAEINEDIEGGNVE
ncbi:MAG: DUF4366 domain-containing protein [Ruminococcus sp.]|nr:DUF4366 domain-containing protein [Ruminococcus sp.]